MKRYEEVLQFVSIYKQANGKAPTIRRIGDALGMRSTNTVAFHLRRLEERGMIRREPFSRNIDVLVDWQRVLREDRGVATASCPACGSTLPAEATA